MKCSQCQNGEMQRVSELRSLEIDDHIFKARVPAFRCSSCDGVFFVGNAEMELRVAIRLADAGEKSPAVMRFMRKALGLRATDLAELLDISPEHISRWENGKAPVDHRAMALASQMVLDKGASRTTTVDGLKALKEPHRLPKEVKIEMEIATA